MATPDHSATNSNTTKSNTGNDSNSSGGARQRSSTLAKRSTGGMGSGTPLTNGKANRRSSGSSGVSTEASRAPTGSANAANVSGTTRNNSSSNNNNNPAANNHSNNSNADGAASRHLQPGSNHSRVNLFVRDLPADLKEDQLRAMFAPYGEIVNSAIMRNIHTGVSLGTAFVRYAQHTEAMRAMEAFAGGRAMAGQKRVTVQWARREHDKAPAGDERKRMRKLFIRNVPKDVTQEMLTQLFSQFGPVKTVSTHRDTAAAGAVWQGGGTADPGSADAPLDSSAGAAADDRRIAFVTFDVEGVAEQATAAIHNTMPYPSCNGIPLMVKLAEDTPVRHTSSSSNNNNYNNNHANFSAIGAFGSVNRQPSNPTANWGDYPSNDYLHSPSMSNDDDHHHSEQSPTWRLPSWFA